MSAISWTANASAAPLISSNALKTFARQLGFGLGLITVTSAALAGILLTVLMLSSIIQF